MDCADSDRYEPNFTDSVTSTSSLLLPTAPDPKPYEERRRLRIGYLEVSLLWSNVLFAFLASAGQFGEDATLPLWLHSTNNSNSSARTVDGYFVLSFSSLSFVLLFGVALLLIRVLWPRDIGDTERRFSHRLLFLVGLCNALSAVLTVFASNSLRTPLYLQTILGISMIPSTILFRRLILKKKPTLRKLLCAAIVTVAPVFCLIPTFVPNLDSKHATQQSEADGVSKVLWPLIFTISYVLTAIMNVLEEKGLKIQNEMSRRGVNLVYFLFWTSVYQFLCVAALFWVDILPWYGNTNHGMDDFGTNWWFGIQCFFGAAGCDATSGTRGTMFILMYVLTYVGGANLLRHAEGATWLAIVTSLTTPLGFIFWSLFSEVPFKWQSDDHVTTAAVAIGAIFIMFPAVIIYNMGAPEISLNDDNSRREASQHS